jgi:Flp pilus assembly protein TadB
MAGNREQDIEKHLLALQKESQKEKQRLKHISAFALIISGFLVAIIFLFVLYYSPKRFIDVAIVVGALLGSLVLIGRGLKRLIF